MSLYPMWEVRNARKILVGKREGKNHLRNIDVGKVVPVLTKHHAVKTYWGVEVSGQLRALATLPPGKEPLVPIG
jgi:hypothetical protein